MTTLHDFTDDGRMLLIGLPYVVGVFVSHADDVDGEHDDEREIEALERAISGIAKLHEGQPLVAEIMAATLAHKDMWAQWEGRMFQAPRLSEEAIGLILEVGSEKNAKNYRAALMEIASAVAQAFGEFGEFEEEPSKGFFGSVMDKVVGKVAAFSEDDAGHPANISAAENSAIQQLQQAMRFKT